MASSSSGFLGTALVSPVGDRRPRRDRANNVLDPIWATSSGKSINSVMPSDASRVVSQPREPQCPALAVHQLLDRQDLRTSRGHGVMSKLYIADSEDEDDADTSPLSPPPASLPTLAQGHSSDPLSRGTDSTDTAFFRSIYHEQAEAVQERVRGASKDVAVASAVRASRADELWDVPSSPDPQPASGRRKRRKLSNDDDAGTPIHTRNQDDVTESSMLPPTLQIDDEAGFVITPTAMTKSQQQGYVSVEHASSLGHDAGPASHGMAQRKLDLALSSSGTNVNTPRPSDEPTQASNGQEDSPNKPSDGPQTHTPSYTAMAAPPRRRRLSSPDVITIAEASGYQEDHYEPVEEDELAQQSTTPAKDNGTEEYQEPVVIEDDDSPFEDEPVKPKKERGRPKKSKPDPVVLPPTTEPPEEPADKTKPGKKKRGRPRKEQSTPKRPVERLEEVSTKIEGDGQDAGTSELVSAPPDAPESNDKQRSESNGDTKPAEQKALQGDEKPQPEAASEAVSTVQLIDEKATKVGKAKAPDAGLRDDGKPVYRVGLSKRSRIAPLLKIIKK